MFKHKLNGIFVLMILLVLSFVSATIVSIGNARMVLYPNISSGEPTVIEKSIQVINVNNYSVNVTLKPDESLENYTTILDNAFILEPDESVQARFNLTFDQPGRYDGRIFVDFLPTISTMEGENSTQAVGIASRIIVIARNVSVQNNSTVVEPPIETNNSSLTGIMFLVLLLGVIFYLHFRKGVKK